MKTIKIPKVNPNDLYSLHINGTGIITSHKYRSDTYYVVLKAQTIEGVKIPAGLAIWVEYIDTAGIPQCKMSGTQLNGLLKTLYLDTLRKGK